MSKNQDRYKEDYSHIDIEELEEMDTEKFEKFHPKKKPAPKKKENMEGKKNEW